MEMESGDEEEEQEEVTGEVVASLGGIRGASTGEG